MEACALRAPAAGSLVAVISKLPAFGSISSELDAALTLVACRSLQDLGDVIQLGHEVVGPLIHSLIYFDGRGAG